MGPDDFQVSSMGSSPAAFASGTGGRVLANDDAGVFIALWSGDPLDSLQIERDIYCQAVDPGAGVLVGPGPLRISDAGPPGVPGYDAYIPVPVHLAGTDSDLVLWTQTVVPWEVEDDTGLFLQKLLTCASAAPSAETVRLGVPPNPLVLQPGATSGPLLGGRWDPFVDHAVFLPGAVLDVLALAATPLNVPTAFGTLLLDPGGWPLFSVPASQPFAILVPADCSLAGAALYSQAGSLTAGGAFGLTNGLDLTLGTF